MAGRVSNESEAAIQAAIQTSQDVQELAVLWRNHTGQLMDETGRVHRFGLGRGSPDLVGFLKGSGRFVGIEVKTLDGRIRPEQHAWVERARTLGAIAGVARSVGDALRLLRGERG